MRTPNGKRRSSALVVGVVEQQTADEQAALGHNQPPEDIDDPLAPFIQRALEEIGFEDDVRFGRDFADRKIRQRRKAQIVYTEKQLKEWSEARRHLPQDVERRIKVRQGLVSDEDLHTWFRQQKALSGAEIAERRRVASGIFHDPDISKKSARRERELQSQQTEIPGTEDWRQGYKPSLLLPTRELIKQFRELTNAEDDLRHDKAKLIVELEKRFDAGERGSHITFRSWCAEHIPEHKWPYLRSLLRIGKDDNSRQALALAREKNRQYNNERNERLRQEAAALLAAEQAEADRSQLRSADDTITTEATTTEVPTDQPDELLQALRRVVARMKFDKDRIRREWPAEECIGFVEDIAEVVNYAALLELLSR